MRTVATTIGIAALVAAAGLLGACVNETSANDKKVAMTLPAPFSDFTTQGKPTKTLSTPDGEIEIYDPTQDPDVREAFRTVYDWGVANAASEDPIRLPFDYNAYNRFLSHRVRSIQKLDLMRANCTNMIIPPAGATYAGHESGTCEMNWGEPLSSCERDMMGLKTDAESEPVILRHVEYTSPELEDSNGQAVTVANLEDIGPKSAKMPHEGFEEQLGSFYSAECKSFKR